MQNENNRIGKIPEIHSGGYHVQAGAGDDSQHGKTEESGQDPGRRTESHRGKRCESR